MSENETYYSSAVQQALREAMQEDESVVLIGEDIGVYGGAFGVTRGLSNEFDSERIWETPISENSFVGAAIGAAAMGLRPVVEIMFMDFIALAMDQIVNSAGKLRYMYDGQIKLPLVIRTPGGAKGGYGPSHSQMLTNMLVGVPGIKIVAPSTPHQAKSLLKAAIRDDNPVIFIENKRLYASMATIGKDDVFHLDKAVIASKGEDLTLLAYSAMVPLCLELKEAFLPHGINIEVIDLVSIQPLDKETIFNSVNKTGKVVIAEESCLTGGVGAEVSALIAEHCLDYLEAPIQRVAAADIPIPSSPSQEKHVLPSAKQIADAIKKTLNW